MIMKGSIPCCLAVLLVAFGCLERDVVPKKTLSCKADAPSAEAMLPTGRIDANTFILPDGRMLRPAGEQSKVGYFPIALAMTPDGKTLYVANTGRTDSLMALDAATGEVKQTVNNINAFNGLAVSRDGSVLIASGSLKGKVHIFDIAAGQLTSRKAIALSGFISGVALSPDGKTLYAVENTSSLLHIVDIESESKSAVNLGRVPYDVLLSADGAWAYVSNWASNTVSFIELASKTVKRNVPTGRSPQGMALSPDGALLYVTCSDSDEITVIDTAQRAVKDTISLTENDGGLKAATPNDLAIDSTGNLLYVAMADLNMLLVVSTASRSIVGKIPTGMYPVRVRLDPAGRTLYVVNAKGEGMSSTDPRVWDGMLGTLSRITLPTSQELASHTRVAEANTSRPGTFYNTRCKEVVPHPTYENEISPIKHVVLIVRENQTYDSMLGDFERGNGAPALAIFGSDITVNLHKLAREFVNLDNFFSNAEVSLQGHMWTTQADCNDFVEKSWFDQLPLAGYDPVTMPSGGTISDLCYKNGVSFRNYGEVVGFGLDTLGKYAEYIDIKFPFFNMDIPDVEKAKEFIRELELGIFPSFIYITLPNDHTFGSKVGKPTPEYMVADNDRATGMIVEAISKSPFWHETIIFIIEDDPQSGSGDHVDAHRSICIPISPWVKRGYTSSVNYSIPSLYKTIELILGLPPMNLNDAGAAPMYDIFSDQPDYTPYDALPLSVAFAVNTIDSPMAAESMGIGSRPDGYSELGDILWRVRRGNIPRPSYAKRIKE